MITDFCASCINSRVIVSENGYHSNCCLSSKKAMNCVLSGYKKYFIPIILNLDKQIKKDDN